MKCSLPEESWMGSFIFYCKDQSDVTIVNEYLNENTFNLRTADLNSESMYKCTCRLFEKAGKWPTSPQSNQLVFTVLDSLLPAPRLSSSLPHTLVMKGEEISLKCSLPEKNWAESFIFYCKDQSDLTVKYEHLSTNTFELRTADLNSDQIKIKCICWYLEPPEGWPPSLQSNQMVFCINDVLPSPVLKVDPLSRRVREGDPLVFLCSAEGGKSEKKFHFYKDGVEITSSPESPLKNPSEPSDLLQNGSLEILHATFNHSGEFACSYEENINGLWILSSWSQGVNVTVSTQDSDPIWRYSWMAIPLIILLVLFLFCCWRKKSTSPSHEQFQFVEKKEEGDVIGMMEPPATRAATSSSVKDSEATYSCIQDSFIPSPAGPTRKNRLTQREEEGILYSDIVFQPKRRQQSHP